MKTYGVGAYRIGVYETCDAWPRDAVAVVADRATICFVDRIAEIGDVVAVGAMTEAVTQHCRLKIAAQGVFELRFDEPLAEVARHWARSIPSLWTHR
ncbi:hypothetical protein [Rhodoblastus sp.]|uniref:hypothetical protein n=1 Tax=Rhodoblastus sp. TaxID=1962975 RepID=UPI003F977DE2